MLGSTFGRHHKPQQIRHALPLRLGHVQELNRESLSNLSFMPPYAGDQHQGRAAESK